jgi:glycerophosphoryl diester phosphodiesterase
MLYGVLLVVALGTSGCGTPRALSSPTPPVAQAAPPTSSVHYRSFADADALTLYMRRTPEAAPLVSAHRGAPVPGLAENSLEAFEHALNYAPALIELDVRRSLDGVLVLMHDETLDRTTTGTGRVDATAFAALRRLRLRDVLGTPTPFRIPTFAETLAWAEGRAVLMLDVKADVPYAELLDAIRRAQAENRVCIIVYSAEDFRTVRRLAPDLMISVSAATPAEFDALLPDEAAAHRVIGFAGVGAMDPEVVARFHRAGVRVQVGTFPLDDDARLDPAIYDRLLQAGADVLATDNVPGAAAAVQREALQRRAVRSRE